MWWFLIFILIFLAILFFALSRRMSDGPAVAVGLAGALVVTLAINHFYNAWSEKKELEVAAEEAKCRADLGCWGKRYAYVAGPACSPYIERLAKYTHKWDDVGFLGSPFSLYRWRNQVAGSITYVGDRIQFQNGFGAWQYATYECDYDPAGKKVLDVRAYPGRLPVNP